MKTAKCSICKKRKKISEFPKDKRRTRNNSVGSQCKACRKKVAAKYRESHRDQIRDKAREYRKNNNKQINEYFREYYRKDIEKSRARSRNSAKKAYWRDPEKGRAATRKYNKDHPEKRRASEKRWRKNNREKYLEGERRRSKRWRDKHPKEANQRARNYRNSHRDHVRAYNNIKRHRRRAGGKFTVKQWEKLCRDCGNKCLRCGSTTRKLTIDHIIPITKDGKNIISNVQPLCGKCNLWKSTKTIDYRPLRVRRKYKLT